MDWKNSLDKYLTTPYDDGFDNWYENVIENIDYSFYQNNEVFIIEYSGQCNAWLNKLFKLGYSSYKSAKMIERLFNIYIKE